MSGSRPQTASTAMAEETADWYVNHTAGQLRKVRRNGTWYLAYASAVAVQPFPSQAATDLTTRVCNTTSDCSRSQSATHPSRKEETAVMAKHGGKEPGK